MKLKIQVFTIRFQVGILILNNVFMCLGGTWISVQMLMVALHIRSHWNWSQRQLQATRVRRLGTNPGSSTEAAHDLNCEAALQALISHIWKLEICGAFLLRAQKGGKIYP